MDLKSKIILISGPTASGKTNFAIKLAKKINGEIINADSMQIYKQLKILTARPKSNELKKVKHHLYGFCDVKKKYSFKKDNIDMVFVDEIQFLDTLDTLKNIELILNEGIDVVCAGLDQDSRGKPWETSSMILGLSDKILKIYGFCNVCGMEATKTYRKQEGGGRTQVGAANIYEPRCLKHWSPR